MTERKFDDITRIYDLDSLDDSYFPTKEIEKGFWRKRKVPAPDRDNLTHARISLTNRILQETGKILGKELRLAGIEKDKITEVIAQLPQKLGDINYQEIEGEKIMGQHLFKPTVIIPRFYRGNLGFVILNGSDQSIGNIDYSIGIMRVAYHGPYLDRAGGMELTIFGEAIKNPEQFNALQFQTLD